MTSGHPALLEKLFGGTALAEAEAHALMHDLAGGEMPRRLARPVMSASVPNSVR